VLGPECLVVAIGQDDAGGERARTVRVRPVGPGWTGRWPEVEAAMARLARSGPDAVGFDRDGTGAER
jgi:hypothetical protein